MLEVWAWDFRMCVFDGLARSRRRHHKYQVAASWRESGKPAGIKAGRASQSLYSFFCACSPLAPHSRNAPVTSPDTTHWPFGDIAAQVVFLTWPGKQQMLPFHIDRFRTNLESNLPWHSLASRKCRPAFFGSSCHCRQRTPNHIAAAAVEEQLTCNTCN